MMFNIYKLKVWLNWPSFRAHISTLAVALSFNSTWRVPRDAFRYGGIIYGLVYLVAMVTVALPIALFQLSVGQLSQQDAVGIWRAVPFFKGVGYLRVLITYLGSIYTATYVGITGTIFFKSLNNSSDLYWNSWDTSIPQDSVDDCDYNISACVNTTILEPVQDQPEYFTATALITLLLWVLFPIILYSPVKFMKRIFYGAAPLVLVLAITILSRLGDKDGISLIYDSGDWNNFGHPEIWHSTITQALWSAQIAGGFLISVGDTVYSCTDVQWTAVTYVVVNILTSMSGLIFWHAIGGTDVKDTSVLAVLEQTYKLVEQKHLSALWPMLIFAMLISSGVITALTLLYPLYDRLKRISGRKWRYLVAGSSLVGAGAGMAALAAGLPALTALDDVIVPFLISVTTILEICPFLFIYGWKVLIEDIEFLVGRDISKYWMWGWCCAIGVILSSTTWWLVAYILNVIWTEPTWSTSGLVAAAGATLFIVVTFATISVARQVQYDVIGKLKSSFKPSRHWGPRDPITHYYWLARRDDAQRDQPRTRYNRRQLGQFSGNSNFLNINISLDNIKNLPTDGKRRSNSDDWLYTSRKQCVAETSLEHKLGSRKRAKSLDLAVISNFKQKKGYVYRKELSLESGEVTSVESISSVAENNKFVKHTHF